MNNYFEIKIRYERIDERGSVKKVTEPYLVDAMSFSEAEERIIREMEPYLSGEFEVTAIKKVNFSDLFPFDDSDRWFKCKISYISIDEEKGTEKKKASHILVQANDVRGAWENLTESMKDSVVDYEANVIGETSIMDVFPFLGIQETFKEEITGHCNCGAEIVIIKHTESSSSPFEHGNRYFTKDNHMSNITKCSNCTGMIHETFVKENVIEFKEE